MHESTPQVRRRILRAASRVIAEDGAERLSLNAVAARAELSVGGLRYHFASKRELLVALLDASIASVDQALDQAGPEPGDRTRAYLDATLSDNGGNVDAAAGLLAAVAVDSSLLAELRRHYQRWQDLIADDGIDPAVSTAIRLAMDGWWMAAFLELAPPRGELARRTQAVLEDLLDLAVN